MDEEQPSLATWMLIVSGLFAVLELGVSISMCLSPESVFENVDLNGRGVYYLIQMWAVRQFALGFIFGFATYKRSVPMLTLAYTFFLVMFAGDFFVGIVQKENSLVISAVVMSIVSSAMLFAINKRR